MRNTTTNKINPERTAENPGGGRFVFSFEENLRGERISTNLRKTTPYLKKPWRARDLHLFEEIQKGKNVLLLDQTS